MSQALQQLQDIMHQLNDLQSEADAIIREHFPHERSWVDAYQVTYFGHSGNPYDNTFEKLIENIEKELMLPEEERMI
jgi:hypothetical protein